jgi:hypothetical protein
MMMFVFCCSDRHRRHLVHHGATVPRRSDDGRDQSSHRVGFRPRKKFIFEEVHFRCSGFQRHHLGHHGRGIAAIPPRTANDRGNRVGIRLVDHGDRGGTWLADRARLPPHVVIAVAVPIGWSSVWAGSFCRR